jgi:putative multiple sugar transport system ATP-binding protein
MNDGAFVGEFAGPEANQEKIMHAIMRNRSIGNGVREAEVRMGGMRP